MSFSSGDEVPQIFTRKWRLRLAEFLITCGNGRTGNPDPSEDPCGGGLITLPGGAQSSLRPDTVRDNRSDYEVHEGRMQTGFRAAYAGSTLKPPMTREGTAWKAGLAAVLGKTRRTE